MTTAIDSDLGDWSDLVSIELFTAIADNLSYLIDSVPVGTIMPILVGLTGVPTPDPTIWQEAKGETIEEQLSDLRGESATDMTNRMIKGAASTATSGISGGSDSVDLTHAHGGHTQGMTPSPTKSVDGGDSYWSMADDHTHVMSNDLSTVNLEPLHVRLRYYLKIR